MACIFCKDAAASFTTEEHIVPESLGGGDWSLLPDGLVCDKCQNYFGAKIERNVLSDAPFHIIRTLLSLPTKKRRAPKFFDPLEGTLEATGLPNSFCYEPSPCMQDAIEAGRKSQMRFPVRPKDPRAVCRFLLKIGIETLAVGGRNVALLGKYDAARDFESPRVLRRLQPLREWSHEEAKQDEQVSPRSPRACGAAGSGAPRRVPVAVGRC